MVRERLVEMIQNLAPTPIAWIAIVVGVFVHFIGFFLFKIQVPGLVDYQSPEPFVSYVKLDESDGQRDLRDQALLSDSAPLFLPSEMNYAWQLMQPGFYLDNQNPNMLRQFQYDVALGTDDILSGLAERDVSFTPEALLGEEVWQHYRTLGEIKSTPPSLPERFALLEFQEEGSRQVVSTFEILENPLGIDLSSTFWRPAVALVYVGTEGSLGAPFLRESTGIVALDQYFVKAVQQKANNRLIPKGYYRVVFGH